MTYRSYREQLITPPLQFATYADTFSETEVYRTPDFVDRSWLVKEAGFIVQDGSTDADLTWTVYSGPPSTGTQLHTGTGGVVERDLFKTTKVGEPLTMSLAYTGTTVTGAVWLIFAPI